MNRKIWVRYLLGPALFFGFLVPLIGVSFQNCANKSFHVGADEKPVNPQCQTADQCVNPDPQGTFVLIDHVVTVELNTSKDWNPPFSGDKKDYVISLSNSSNLNSLVVPNKGEIFITNSTSFAMRFTPIFGFRGDLVQTIYGRDTAGNVVAQAQVTIKVGNALNFFQPALAVRAGGCVMCHADVRSNIISDFGYGNAFYFGANLANNSTLGRSWNHGASYGDHDAFFIENAQDGPELGSWAQLKHIADKKVYVPMATIGVQEARTKSGQTTLAGYLTQRFSKSPYAGTKAANKVAERSEIFIGAPTAAKLLSVFGGASTNQVKYQADPGGVSLAGITVSSNGQYLTNTGVVTCEGDVLVNGTLYLNNMTVQSRTGCRLYVTGSVFIYGPIDFSNNDSLRNLQITSSKSILMGLGNLMNGSNHCEANAGEFKWYYNLWQTRVADTNGLTQAQKDQYYKAISDSAYMRLVYFWMTANYFYRNDSRPWSQIGTEIYNELLKVGLPADAACRAGGRGVSYSRLLLNAPHVESRYNGDFIGSIITEVPMMALGQFKFEFDPVFSNIPILPKLTDRDFLYVQ